MLLTGDIRYRRQRFTGKLILQVKMKYKETIMYGPFFESYDIITWVDATMEHLQALKEITNG